MRFRVITLAIFCSFSLTSLSSQIAAAEFSAAVTVSKELQPFFSPEGRLFVIFSRSGWAEPRTQTWPGPGNPTTIFARNMKGVDPAGEIPVCGTEEWIGSASWSLENVPGGEYYLQILWDQDQVESGINAPGNLYSDPIRIRIDEPVELEIELNQRIGERSVVDHPLVREITLVSDTLSAWWGKPVQLKASVLLPGKYEMNRQSGYPISYNVAGYGGRYTRVNQLVNSTDFMDWWTSDDAPQIINVFLDGEGPFGDSYQMDSENSGPYGYALIHELIPHIESKYRGTSTPETRFVNGCSTGGWVSLALQIFYPDQFNGTYSYSPDAIDFEHYQLVNIYRDQNAFTNEYNLERPIMRDTYGEPMVSWKNFVQFENVLGASNSYLTSGGQICSHNALYSPKGDNGLPKPLIDPFTGEIDRIVAEHWKKYDLKLHCRENWEILGPQLEGKIFIWMGDMDNFYLNTGTRSFAAFIQNTQNPKSDAEIIFSPMEGHCSQYSIIEVVLRIQQRIDEL